MSQSMRFVVTPLPTSDDTLFDCIKSAISRPAIRSVPVSQITVGPRHVGLLLEDGRVYRASYQVQADRLEFPPATPRAHHAQQSLSSMPPGGGSGGGMSLAGASTSVSVNHHHTAQSLSQNQNPSVSGSNSQMNTVAKPPLTGSSGVGGGSGGGGGSSSGSINIPPGVASVISSPGGGVQASIDARNVSGNAGGGVISNSSSGNPGGVSHGPPGGSSVPTFPGRVNISPQVGGLSVHRQVARRGRMFRHTATRGRGASVIMGSRSVIPAQYVPEDLINQAQVVLQGKPRSAIVRELQRTNLDVNSAVNNLLSSDNEDPEDMDESQDYLPNEDLMSLLDSSVSLPSGPTSVLIDAETAFPEDVFQTYTAQRVRPNSLRHSVGSGRSLGDSSMASELEVRRIQIRDPSQSRRWLEHALRDPQGSDNLGASGGGSGSGSKMGGSATPTDFTLHHKNDSNQSAGANKKFTSNPEINPIQISDNLELWPGSNDKKFVQIACLHSELIAVSNTGQIHQWKWSEPAPFDGVRHGDTMVYHPKAVQLNLANEKVQMISSSCVRATVVTETSRVATWIDDTISIVGHKLEHGAQTYPEFHKGDKIVQLQVCSLYSCVRLESGVMYWWGVAPFSQRKKNWKKIQSKSSKHGSSGSNEISVGSIVCLKNGPSFGDGAIGFTTKDGVPRVGRLIMSAWNITDTCNFKILQPSEKKSTQQQQQQQQQQNPQTSESKSVSHRMKKMLGNQPLDFSGSVTSADDQQQQQQTPSSPGMSKSGSQTSISERSEMPPPPSPASSTCSEPGCSPAPKRRHKALLPSSKDDDKSRDEEQWNLKDVIFLEEVKKPPAAKVIKLDGNTALVRFNQRDPFGHQSDSDVNAYLQECRMIRKDDLQLAKETTSSSRIIDCQRSPKRLNIADSRDFITFTVSNNGIHALVRTGPKIEYKMYQLASGKVSKSLFFPTDTNAFLGRDPSLITLYACGESDVAVTLRDGNGSLYPLAKDFLDSIREPQPSDMAPVQSLGMAVHPVRDLYNPMRTNPTLVMAMALENQILIPAVLRSDPEFVKLTLASIEREPVSQQIVASEKIDLNRNVLHAAVYSCAPTPNSCGGGGGSGNNLSTDRNSRNNHDDSFDPYPAMSRISNVLNESMKRSRVKREGSSSSQQQHQQQSVNSAASSTLDLSSDSNELRQAQQQQQQQRLVSESGAIFPASGEVESPAACEWSNTILSKIDIDPTEQKQSAHVVLLILVECPVLRPFLKDLMIQRDAHGMTPFMSAVSSRAYTAALILLELAQWIIANQEMEEDMEDAEKMIQKQRLFNMMIFPPGTNLDNNPLYMLCANDTCSFTWTGAQHINQDIFECKTCGLTRTLCCCTECARTCHKGHDCRLKKTSPTAYCDCWEKCKCKSLVAGLHYARFKLLERLLEETDLATYPDSKGESILLFLVQTVARQIVEQRQYVPDRSRHSKRDDPIDMPDHDMSPPRFARKALHKMLGDWLALKSVITSGTTTAHNLASVARMNNPLNVEDQIFLSGQQGTALLDRFTHSLLIKIGPEMLDVLLSTIIRESMNTNSNTVYEARLVAKRFVRSVARNGVVLSVELSPVNYSQQLSVLDLPSMLNQVGASPYGGGSSGGGASSSWKLSNQQPASILQKCRKVFQALLPIAAEELAEIADALVSPVRLGVPRPTAPFSLVNSMAEATQGSEEIFVVEPVVLPASSSSTLEQQDGGGGQLQAQVVRQLVVSQQVRQQSSSALQQISDNNNTAAPTLASINEVLPPTLNENPSSANSAERMRDMLFDGEIAMEALDSEDADASNNTFRRSNNGESDSDSDSNMDDASLQSNLEPNGPRSTATGATAGSEVGASTVAYFSEPDSGDSSNGDEDEESEGNDTEHDNDDLLHESFSFSRRANLTNSLSHHHHHHHHHHQPSSSDHQASLHHHQQQQHQQQHHQAFRTTNLGQQLHWALRHREQSFYPPPSNSSLPSAAARLASIGLAGAYNYNIDGAPSNRRPVISSSGVTNSLGGVGGNELSMYTTAVGLSRAFSIIIRSISDLIPILKEAERSDSSLTINQFRVSPSEATNIICNLEKKLNPIWEWLFKVMDSTEGQLRFGCALTNGIQAVASRTSAISQQSNIGNSSGSSSNNNNQTHRGSIGGYVGGGGGGGVGLSGSSGGAGVESVPSAGGGSVPIALNTSNVAPYLAQQIGSIPVHPAMLARVNANLSAHSLGRRAPNLFDQAGRSGGGGSNSSSGLMNASNVPGVSDHASAAVRLHNPLDGQSSSSSSSSSQVNRPQSLTTRSNLTGPNYVTRMTSNDAVNEAVIDGTAARRDFLSYMISLIRGHGNEHHDSLPILDVSSLRHVAYVFDAYVYYLRALNRDKAIKPLSDSGMDDEDFSLSIIDPSLGSRHQFFRRSESALSLDGSIAPDPFGLPISEALPLAEQPHLLQPNSRREDLFGMPKPAIHDVTSIDSLPIQMSLNVPSCATCSKCIALRQLQTIATAGTSNTIGTSGGGGGASSSSSSNSVQLSYLANDKDLILCPLHRRNLEQSKLIGDAQHTALLGRWKLTVELFGREFLDDVGAEPGSILTDLVGFPLKENRFRKDMERLRGDSAPREISLTNIDRDKNILIRQTIKELNNTFHLSERSQSRRNHELPLLACSKVKVSFKDEKGEGNGVARSFYTAFCEAVLSNERLANLDVPLFYQPGLRNFYSPRQGDASPERLNAFRNIGRVIGICLSQSEICPIQLNRHVIKYILRKSISWHDLAFFDPILYESLRQLVFDAETNSLDGVNSALQSLELRFCVDFCAEEGGEQQVELAPGGKNIEVTPSNIYEYVRRYSLKRMFKSQEKALQAIRQGVMDVLPPSALDSLTAEDFRLLLNGVGEINVQTLISYTTFIDDRATSASKRNSVQVDEQLGYFKKWFWSIVEKMTTKEKQDLVYFWTGTPSLPASEEGFQPMPTVSIRPAEDLHLPSSNVCIFRLYIPLYSSKAILKSKLLVAIKEKNFGFI